MVDGSEIVLLERAIRRAPGLEKAVARDQLRLQNLPYCILSAIYSINRPEKRWKDVIDRYQQYFDLPPRQAHKRVPDDTREPKISELIRHIETLGPHAFAKSVLRDMSPTSSAPSASLRSAAALEYARVLQWHNIDTMSDIRRHFADAELEAALRSVSGQGSGISTDWFFMNAGDVDRVKWDRRVRAFLRSTLGREVPRSECLSLFRAVAARLEPDYPGLHARALDLLAWDSPTD